MTDDARTRIAKIRAYAEPVSEQAGTYADLVWLCDELIAALDKVDHTKAFDDRSRVATEVEGKAPAPRVKSKAARAVAKLCARQSMCLICHQSPCSADCPVGDFERTGEDPDGG